MICKVKMLKLAHLVRVFVFIDVPWSGVQCHLVEATPVFFDVPHARLLSSTQCQFSLPL